ncbi:putative acylesterase/phospholipase RssA [Bradyrhizobium sp. S3.3.6]|uniref:patatin-like phospholipase family protein n=1 Tax=Bradyrhizobium sp. S3.3.6 TaxID=3156429 RepID=UPI0033908619
MGTEKTAYFKSCLGVFQGGGCRAAAFAGAFEEAVNRGVSFSEVAGTSAGSIIAALIGAGATPRYVREKLAKLDFLTFLQPPERNAKRSLPGNLVGYAKPQYADIYYDQGLYSSEAIKVWFEGLLSELLPSERKPIQFKSLPFPTYIVSTDIVRSEAKVWSQHSTPEALVSDAVRASCSIPIFFQPVDRRHVDGGLLSNLPAYVFADRTNSERTLASKILAFSLVGNEPETAAWSTSYFLSQLASTLVDGGQQLQLGLQSSVYVISINTGEIRATDFAKLTPDAVTTLVANGSEATSKFFDNERMHIRASGLRETACLDVDEFYARVTESLEDSLDRIVISEHDTDWVYKLFPTILCWRARGVRVDAILPENGETSKDGPYRRNLLRALGVNVCILPGASSVPCRATVIVPKDAAHLRALVGVQKQSKVDVDSVLYEGFLDASVIQAVLHQLENQISTSKDAQTFRPTLRSTPSEALIARLKTIRQYEKHHVTITLEQVPVRDLVATSRFTREYKYNQIRSLVDLYHRFGLPLFEPAVVDFGNGKSSIVTPPVVEELDGKYILIEGSTRATYCRDAGIASFVCLVVRGVTDRLPSRTLDFNKVRVTGRLLAINKRYESFDYSHFRHIERTMHPLDSLNP